MLTGALTEVMRGERAPDLRVAVLSRLRGSTQASPYRRLVALLLVALGLATVTGVSVWSGAAERVGAQDPKRSELESPAELRERLAERRKYCLSSVGVDGVGHRL